MIWQPHQHRCDPITEKAHEESKHERHYHQRLRRVQQLFPHYSGARMGERRGERTPLWETNRCRLLPDVRFALHWKWDCWRGSQPRWHTEIRRYCDEQLGILRIDWPELGMGLRPNAPDPQRFDWGSPCCPEGQRTWMERPIVERWASSPAPAGLIPRGHQTTPAGQTLLGFFVSHIVAF